MAATHSTRQQLAVVSCHAPPPLTTLPVPAQAQACPQQPARPTPARLTPEAAVRVHSQTVPLPWRPRPPPPAALPCCECGRAQTTKLVVAVGVDAGGAPLCCSLLLQVGAGAAGAPVVHLQRVDRARHQQGAGCDRLRYTICCHGHRHGSAYVAHLDAGWSTSCSWLTAVVVSCRASIALLHTFKRIAAAKDHENNAPGWAFARTPPLSTTVPHSPP